MSALQPDPTPGIVKRTLSDASATISEFKRARSQTASPDKLKSNLQQKLTELKAGESYSSVRKELIHTEIKKVEWQLLAASALVSLSKMANFFKEIGKKQAVERAVDAIIYPYSRKGEEELNSFMNRKDATDKLYKGLVKRISTDGYDKRGIASCVEKVLNTYVTDKSVKANLGEIAKRLKNAQ